MPPVAPSPTLMIIFNSLSTLLFVMSLCTLLQGLVFVLLILFFVLRLLLDFNENVLFRTIFSYTVWNSLTERNFVSQLISSASDTQILYYTTLPVCLFLYFTIHTLKVCSISLKAMIYNLNPFLFSVACCTL